MVPVHKFSVTSSLELAAFTAILAYPKEQWGAKISKLVQLHQCIELTVSPKAADTQLSEIVEHHQERIAAKLESRKLIEAVFDAKRDGWNA